MYAGITPTQNWADRRAPSSNFKYNPPAAADNAKAPTNTLAIILSLCMFLKSRWRARKFNSNFKFELILHNLFPQIELFYLFFHLLRWFQDLIDATTTKQSTTEIIIINHWNKANKQNKDIRSAGSSSFIELRFGIETIVIGSECEHCVDHVVLQISWRILITFTDLSNNKKMNSNENRFFKRTCCSCWIIASIDPSSASIDLTNSWSSAFSWIGAGQFLPQGYISNK